MPQAVPGGVERCWEPSPFLSQATPGTQAWPPHPGSGGSRRPVPGKIESTSAPGSAHQLTVHSVCDGVPPTFAPGSGGPPGIPHTQLPGPAGHCACSRGEGLTRELHHSLASRPLLTSLPPPQPRRPRSRPARLWGHRQLGAFLGPSPYQCSPGASGSGQPHPPLTSVPTRLPPGPLTQAWGL